MGGEAGMGPAHDDRVPHRVTTRHRTSRLHEVKTIPELGPVAPTTQRPGPPAPVTWIVIGLVVIGLVAVALLADDVRTSPTGGRDADGGRSPLETVQGYVEAIRAHDCRALVDHLSDAYVVALGEQSGHPLSRRGAVAACDANPDIGALLPAEIGDMVLVLEDGDAAAVEVESTTNGVTRTEQIPLVREAGEWRVDVPAELGTLDDRPTGIPDDREILVTDLPDTPPSPASLMLRLVG